jgi:hypothetical protein
MGCRVQREHLWPSFRAALPNPELPPDCSPFFVLIMLVGGCDSFYLGRGS